MPAVIVVLGLLMVAIGASMQFAPVTRAATPPAYQHIFFVIDENHGYNQIVGSSSAPYINSLANANGLASNYFAVSHPSLPNYLALVGGSTFGITSDCMSCFIDATNLTADRIAPSGRSWRAYMES